MLSITLAVIAYIIQGEVFFLDKEILRSTHNQYKEFTFYSTIFMLVLLPWAAGISTWNAHDIGVGIFSAASFFVGLLTLFYSVYRRDAVAVNSIIGGVLVVVTYVLSLAFLGERFTQLHLLGVGLIFLALASVAKRQKNISAKIFLFMGVSGAAFAASHVSAKLLFNSYDFVQVLAVTKGLLGVLALGLLSSKIVRSHIFKKKTAINKKGVTIAIDKLLGGLSAFLVQGAIALGNVFVVNALIGVQYITLYVLTRRDSGKKPPARARHGLGALLLLSIGIFCILL